MIAAAGEPMKSRSERFAHDFDAPATATIHPGEDGGHRMASAVEHDAVMHEHGERNGIDGGRGRRSDCFRDLSQRLVEEIDIQRRCAIGARRDTPRDFEWFRSLQIFIEHRSSQTAGGYIKAENVHWPIDPLE